MAWMYILRCKDGTYYVGSTTDLALRVAEHQQGLGGRYTSGRRPVQLVSASEFPSIQQAYDAERQVKGWSRANREALIRGDWDALPGLARSKTLNSDGGARTPPVPSTGSGNVG